MIIKKIIIGLFFVYLLNGCATSTSLLGPVSTFAFTGNITQAGFSYGSSKVVQNVTGKTSTENIKNLLNNKKTDDKDYDEFFALVKSRIEKTSKILANQ